jgi:hypothetical protein
MSNDYAQRRRVALAAAITLIAVPAVFLLGREESAAEPVTATTVVGTVAPNPDAASASAGSADPSTPETDPMGTTPVAYLEGTVPPSAGDGATIAIPRKQRSIKGTASFRRNIGLINTCQVIGVPFGTAVTVTNLDNSRTVQCISSVGGVEPPDDVVMHADAFLQIADLTDAPIPVDINW